MQRIIIAGSRHMKDYNLMRNSWADYTRKHGLGKKVTIISEGARGADKLAERLAKENGLRCEVMNADWKTYGRSAGPIRNAEMEKAAGTGGRLLAFLDRGSRGTASMIKQAQNAGLHVEVVRIVLEDDEAEQLTL